MKFATVPGKVAMLLCLCALRNHDASTRRTRYIYLRRVFGRWLHKLVEGILLFNLPSSAQRSNIQYSKEKARANNDYLDDITN